MWNWTRRVASERPTPAHQRLIEQHADLTARYSELETAVEELKEMNRVSANLIGRLRMRLDEYATTYQQATAFTRRCLACLPDLTADPRSVKGKNARAERAAILRDALTAGYLPVVTGEPTEGVSEQ